jgi:hypothetical protein
VVSIVVPSMLAVLPYARGRGFDSRGLDFQRMIDTERDGSRFIEILMVEF